MNKYVLLLFALLLVNSCSDSRDKRSFTTVPVSEDFSAIADPFARWQAYQLSDYAIGESRLCECFPPNRFTTYIVEDEVADVEYELAKELYFGRTEKEIYDYTMDAAMTVNEAFAIIERYRDSAHRTIVEYDPRFGYPSSIFIDIDTLTMDEEIIRSFDNLEKIVR